MSQPGNELFSRPSKGLHCTGAASSGVNQAECISLVAVDEASTTWMESERVQQRNRRTTSAIQAPHSDKVKALVSCEVSWRHIGFPRGGGGSLLLLTDSRRCYWPLPLTAGSRTAFDEHCWNQFSASFCSLPKVPRVHILPKLWLGKSARFGLTFTPKTCFSASPKICTKTSLTKVVS